MTFGIFASFLVFCAWLAYEISKHKKKQNDALESFWDKERMANASRRKSLDQLNYIRVPWDQLPTTILTDLEAVSTSIASIRALDQLKILNLTGISNTELKLQYGAANLSSLTEYDYNYTLLVRSLQKWGEALLQNNFSREAKSVFEFAIETNTDVSATYKQLAQIYLSLGEPHKIDLLMERAQSLNSMMKTSIIHSLQEIYPDLK